MTLLVVDTAYGTFAIALHESVAPQTSRYFRNLIEQQQLAGAQAFRLLCPRNEGPDSSNPIHVIQFGRESWMQSRCDLVRHEDTRQTGLRHRRGTVSAARLGAGELYGSFFVCMRDEPGLDYGGSRNEDGAGFAAFGEVVSGFDVLERIFVAPIDGERLDPPIAVQGFSIDPTTT